MSYLSLLSFFSHTSRVNEILIDCEARATSFTLSASYPKILIMFKERNLIWADMFLPDSPPVHLEIYGQCSHHRRRQRKEVANAGR